MYLTVKCVISNIYKERAQLKLFSCGHLVSLRSPMMFKFDALNKKLKELYAFKDETITVARGDNVSCVAPVWPESDLTYSIKINGGEVLDFALSREIVVLCSFNNIKSCTRI